MPRLALLVLLSAAACGSNGPGGDGDPCLSTAECEDGTICFPTDGRGDVCMTVCDPTSTRLCDDDRVCFPTGEAGVCYSGGALDLGSICTSSDVCVGPGVCVLFDGESEAHCRRACQTGSSVGCGTGEVCELVGDEPAGVCASTDPTE